MSTTQSRQTSDLREAQEPGYARAGTHVLLPRQFYYELLRLLEDCGEAADRVAAYTKAKDLPGMCDLRAIPGRLAATNADLARHARNSGVY